MTLKNTLYLYSTPKGENEDLLLFMVQKAHQAAALNGCHWDAGHQGHGRTLSLLHEYFWWPGMAKWIRQTIRACTHCLQYEGGFPKAPLCPIVAMAPLDLLHVDFTGIETTMEPNKSPRGCQHLGIPRPLHKAYVTPDQTVKTIANFFIWRIHLYLWGPIQALKW